MGGIEDLYVNSDIILSLSETVNARERQSKFIINSCRAYEYFGYEWLIPLWDMELIKYWEGVPKLERYNRKLYINMVKQKEFSSTADPTMYSMVSSAVRKNKKLADLFRMCRRVMEYRHHSHKLYAMYGLVNNLRTNIKSKGVYTYNTLSCSYYLSLLKEYFKDI